MSKSYETQVEKNDDGSFTFTDYDVQVVADNVDEAIKHAKKYHGIDVTKEPVKLDLSQTSHNAPDDDLENDE